LTATEGNEVRLWDGESGQLLDRLQAPGAVLYGGFVAERVLLVTGDSGRGALAWDVRTHRPIGEPLADATGRIQHLAVSPDARTVLTGSWDRKTARLWDAATGKPLGPPVCHAESVFLVAFTPDGRGTLSYSVDYKVRRAEVPAPVGGTVEQLRCWVELLTGSQLDDHGAAGKLDAEALGQRRERLGELGGPPDGTPTP
jgi:hypothetical protein